jgi:hypothetical protein
MTSEVNPTMTGCLYAGFYSAKIREEKCNFVANVA